MSNSMVYPTFKAAQQLYTQYSTLENFSILNSHLKSVIDSSFLSTMEGQDIHAIYNNIILKYYPNEICIKASFIKQVLMKGKSHVTIFELPVGSSRADLCKINGTSIAYEIKTDLDNFKRLKKQIKDYYKIFEEVYIICSESNTYNIISEIPKTCGIYTYRQTKSGRYIFKLYRAAKKNTELDTAKQLQIVRRSEFYQFFNIDTGISKRKDLIDVTMQIFDSDSINRRFKQILKKRFESQWIFLKQNYKNIYEIDYQWFFKNQIEPSRIYK